MCGQIGKSVSDGYTIEGFNVVMDSMKLLLSY